MSTLVRRRVSGGTSGSDSTRSYAWTGSQHSSYYLPDNSSLHSSTGGYRLGYSKDRRTLQRKCKVVPKVIFALIVLGSLSTWYAVQHWNLFTSEPAKSWLTTTAPELEQLLQNSGQPLDGAFVVFVSVFNGRITRVHREKSQLSAFDAFEEIVDKHMAKKDAKKSDQYWVKIDVVDTVDTVENFDASRQFDTQLEAGRGWFHGLALGWESGWAFLPEEVWAQNMIDAQTNRFRWDNVLAHVRDKERSGGLVDWDFFTKTRNLETSTLKNGLQLFHTKSFLVDLSSWIQGSSSTPQVVTLYHGHRLFDQADVTPSLLMQAATDAGEYLTRSIQTKDGERLSKGQIACQHNPRTNDEFDSYSLSTHAGSLYSMSLLLHDNNDIHLKDAIKLGIDWLIDQHLRECHVPDEEHHIVTKCIVEDVKDEHHGDYKVAKLGLNALGLLAISEFVAASADQQMLNKAELDYYLAVAGDLAHYIQSTQQEDGSFLQKVIVWPKVEAEEETFVRFFLGQATFALSRFYSVNGLVGEKQETQLLEVAEGAANYIAKAQAAVPDMDLFDDPWLMYGLAELHKCGRRLGPQLIDHALRSARNIAERQYTEGAESTNHLDSLDWVGIPDVSSTSAFTAATKSHGLCAAYGIALEYRFHKLEAGWIIDTMKNSASYQLKAQYGPELAMYMQDPTRILGGMRKGVDSLFMRNDYTQHSLSSFLCLAKLLQKSQQ